ncbi:MAG: hypothetical protein U9Q83_03880, partial [Bacteroidota bacterium]|nr:hypothetical protein [Bacteroidota bacterium]
MLIISKFLYKNKETKIHLHHPLPKGIKNKLDKIDSFGYSATHNAWYVSYSKKTLSELKQIEPNLKILQTYNAVMLIDKKQNKIQLTLNNDNQIIKKLNKINNSFRLSKYPKWVIEGTNENYLQIKKILKQFNYQLKITYKKDIDEEQKNPIVKHYVQTMIMRNNSKKTIEIYT